MKNIALVAHDNKKHDLLEWAKWNKALLIEHDLYATGTTGKLLELDPVAATQGWALLMGIGCASVVAVWWFNRWLERQERAAAA